jgi:hypothetical protein
MGRTATIVSCDIVAHSREKLPQAQLHQLVSLNSIVRGVIDRYAPGDVVWASRGDGGHVVFLSERQEERAIEIVGRVRQWSMDQNIAVRVVIHNGVVDLFEGADGRLELVGDDINLVGRIMKSIDEQDVVVTRSFANALDRDIYDDLRSRVHFAPGFWLEADYFPAAELLFLVLDPADRPTRHWPKDADLLLEAKQFYETWNVIYYAKRLMQINGEDDVAARVLLQLNDDELVYTDRTTLKPKANPFFRLLPPLSRIRFVKTAELVERGPGQVICSYGENGESMFIVLKGSVGVILPQETGGATQQSLTPKYVLRPGEIVGELAFALGQRRTATLRCLSKTAFLSFSPDRLEGFYSGGGEGRSVKKNIERFLDSRILRYVCQSVGYLGGGTEPGPLAEVTEPWEQLLPYSKAVSWSWKRKPSCSMEDREFKQPGIYILLSGLLRAERLNYTLDGSSLPALYVDLPGIFVTQNIDYELEGDIKILSISFDGLQNFGPSIERSIANILEKTFQRRFAYDAFISYSFNDWERALRWVRAFEAAGLRVFLQKKESLGRFPEDIVAAIRGSLVLVALISGHTSDKPVADNWVRREILLRSTCFDPAYSNVLPVKFVGGEVETFASGFGSIDASTDEESAIRSAIEFVDAVKSGERRGPISVHRATTRDVAAVLAAHTAV